MLNNKIKGLKKALTLGLIGVASMTTLIATKPNIQASAHNAYFVAIAIDEANFKYVPTVMFEENSWVASNHAEKDVGSFGEKTTSAKDWEVPIPDLKEDTSPEKMEDVYKDRVAKGDGEKALIYTFPPLHGKGIITDKVHANGIDEMLANRYADYVIGGLNDALNFCISQAGAKGKVSTSELKIFSAQLANASYKRSGTVTLTVESTKKEFTVSAGNPSKLIDGLTKADYIKISYGSSSITVPRRVKKGYRNSEERPGLSQDYRDEITDKGDKQDTEYLDWRYTVLQGNYNSDVKSITYSSVNEITKPSAITVAVTTLLGGLLSGLRNLLGLYPMEDLMLNGGSRDANYFYGIMPNSWMSSANLLHIVCQIVAWTFMGFSFVRMLFKRQLQTMNIGERMSLMEGFKNLILTSLLLGSFVIIFTAMAKFNYVLVDLFGKSSAFSGYIGTTQTMNTGALAAVFINFAFFILACYFNVFYVLRGVTIALLYGIAPLCIFSLSLGGKHAQIFNSFMKEMVSNIFIQTFHAICVAFFTSITSTTQMRTFELLVVFMAFIPLTNFVRQNIFGLSSGITDNAQGMVSMGRAMVSGAVGGAVSGAMNRSKKVNGVGGSGGSGGSGGYGSSGGSIAPTNPANSNIQQAMANRQLHADASSIGENGINNSKLMENIGGANKANASSKLDLNPSNEDKFKNAMNKANGSFNVLKGSAQIAGGMMLAGTSLGFGAMGDRMGVSDSIRSGQALRSAGSMNRSSGKAMKNGGESSMLDNTGIDSVYDCGESMLNTYDSSIDDKGNVEFTDTALNNSTYAKNLREMNDVFNSRGDYAPNGAKAHIREDAKARYENQGIIGVGAYDNKFAVNYDKKMTEKKGFHLRNIGEISPYVEPKNNKSSFNGQSNRDNNSQKKNNSAPRQMTLTANNAYNPTVEEEEEEEEENDKIMNTIMGGNPNNKKSS